MTETSSPAPFRIDGRVAVITGGAGLMGREHAHALLDIGAHVVLTDIDADGLDRARHHLAERHDASRIAAFRMDVTSEPDIEATAAKIVAGIGPVGILINNAAIDPKVEPGSTMLERSRLENFRREQWDLELSVGLTGSFLCAKIFGTAMAARGGGTILNIASDLSVIAPDQRLYRKDGVMEALQPVKPVTYSVIKTGLIGLTRYLAGYWAGSGVRVNALSPGGVQTSQPEDFVARLTRLIPLGRMAARDEYRSAVQFLCSDASAYMTGQNLIMDGGRSVL
jgi:NAD(P)-dependent dehydrogenase (short-subunit alcohol dehydrogenase family)